MPAIAKEDVTRNLGAVSDHTVAEILKVNPDIASLEEVAMRLAQEDDVMGDLRKPLSGRAARIYDIVMRDPLYVGEERAGSERL